MRQPAAILLLIALSPLFLVSTAQAKNPVPQGRTYFILVMGLGEDPYSPEADCLTFDATQACTLDGGTCLDWQRLEGQTQSDREVAFALSTQFEEDGITITIEGQGRVDSRGARSSISYVAQARALDQKMNFGFSGRQIGPSRCMQMVADFQAQNSGP